MSPIKYRPEIDGLRAVAVIPVVLFHLGAEWMPGGFIGVDVFFVISGYLITSIILKDYAHGEFSFINFWQRRIRRILPALLVMVVTVSLVGSFILYGLEINNLGKQGVAALLSFSNINFWINASDYWGSQAESSLLLHTWSLSVEEQFYLFFPLLLITLLKFNNKHLIASVLLLTTMSALLFIYGSYNYTSATFYLLPTRAWELGSGSLLALLSYKHNASMPSNSFLSLIGLFTIVASYFFISGEGGVSPYLVFPVIGSVFIIAFSKDDRSISNRVLSLPPIVYIGKISYSLYIWHWPVLVLSKNYSSNHDLQFSVIYIIPIMFLLSIVSYHIVEMPTRKNTKIVPYILLIFIVSVAYSSVLYISDFDEDISAYSNTTWDGQLYDVTPKHEWPVSVKRRLEGLTIPPRDLPYSNFYAEGGIIKEYGEKTPEIVILGDSHALMWSGVLNEIFDELNATVAFYAAVGTSVFFDIPIVKKWGARYFTVEEKYTFDKMRIAYLRKWKPKVVVIAMRWSNLKDIHVTEDLITAIGDIGSKILLIEQPPELFFGGKNAPKYLSYMGLLPSVGTDRYISRANSIAYKKGREIVRQISENNEHCEFIPIADIFMGQNTSNGDKAWVLNDSDVLYIDGDHLSRNGSLKAKDRIFQRIEHYFNVDGV